jgi:hypothetical protein
MKAAGTEMHALRASVGAFSQYSKPAISQGDQAIVADIGRLCCALIHALENTTLVLANEADQHRMSKMRHKL